jgi:hypothetical protein
MVTAFFAGGNFNCRQQGILIVADQHCELRVFLRELRQQLSGAELGFGQESVVGQFKL